jgi:hypothetical protein
VSEATTDTRRRRGRPDEAILVLVGAYLLLVTLYAWQGWRRETLTIFTDELELTQLSRSIAESGQPARRGEAYGLSTLVPWLTAPFWWIPSVAVAYEALKYAQALVMALAIFPAYAIARTVVSRPWALFAAIATIAAPALSYAPILVEEPFAYPAATLALWLVLRAVERPTWASVGAAAGAGALGVAIRSQLAALLVTLAVSLLAVGWRTPRVRAWRSTWTRWDAFGALVLAIGAVLAFSALMGHLSQEWQIATGFWKGRVLEYGVWAAGAFTIGVGVLPVVALLALLGLPAAEKARPGVRSLVTVSASAVVVFCWYAAIKGAYLSTIFSSLIVERNLIYLTPLAFAAAALLLERMAAPVWAVVTAGGVVLALVVATPVVRGIDSFPYYEAHGLSILAFLNRELTWPVERIETALVVLVVASVVALLALRLVRGRSGRVVWLPVTIAALVLTWNLTNEVYAAIGEHDLSARIEQNLADPHDWIDQATDGEGVTVLGQQVQDPTGIWSDEFWNRSIEYVWSVDGTAPGPGPTLTPDLAEPDGTLWPRPDTDYVLAVNGVEVSGEEVGRRTENGPVLVRIGDELRLKANQIGVYSDGWMGASAAYNRFDVADDGDGFATVRLSRETSCYEGEGLPGLVRVRIGTIGVGPDKQPAIDRETGAETVFVPTCGVRDVVFPAPQGPWRIEVLAQTFVPAEVDERLSDRRELGAVVSFGFTPSG